MEQPLTIEETQKGLLHKDFSAVELVDSYFQKIEKHNKELNIYLTLVPDAKLQAKKIDESLKNEGENILKSMPLFGVTVGHKDIILTEGVKTTAGSHVLADYIPQYSATIVKKLDAAGCITLGKLNCDAWAHGSSGENSDFGPTKNPWNSKYVPGGSSSGSGAVVAANMSLVSTSTDTCGSTRLPANFCFAVGLKPTYGAVSRYGVVAMASSLDTVGHITRATSDSRRMFNVMKGIDGKDSTLKEMETHEKKKFKIGIPKEFFEKGLDEEVEKAVASAIEIFKKSGVEFVEVSLPHTKYAVDVYYVIQPAELSSNLARFDGNRYGKGRKDFGEEAKRRIMLGTYVLSQGYWDQYYLKAMKVRSLIIREVENVFDKVDALIAPVAPTPPFLLGEKVNNPLEMYLTDIFAATANLTGIPSLALPYGFSSKNLPLGFQIMGPRFSESRLFDLGDIFERASDYKPMIANLP